jgi:hypothetical protein
VVLAAKRDHPSVRPVHVLDGPGRGDAGSGRTGPGIWGWGVERGTRGFSCGLLQASGPSTSEEAVPAGAHEGGEHEQHDAEDDLALEELDHTDDREDDGEDEEQGCIHAI